jgi:DNA-binding transcriptional ArsR family regulator
MTSEPNERPGSGRPPERERARRLTDPKAMRAMAHPVRMALLELLSAAGTLTATQASEVLGESPANCAFHLRTLAKYGFVEEAGGGRGRERPWRRVPMRLNVSSSSGDPQAAAAAKVLGRAWTERWMDRARHALNRGRDWPEGWADAVQSTRTQLFLTPAELEQIGEELLALLDRYVGRDDPAKRPDGALSAELLFFGYPLTDFVHLGDQD